MKYNIKNTLRAGALAVVGVLAFASCSDTWDDHYEGSTSSLGESYSGTTMGYLQSQPNLSDFVSVLKAAGYESELNDPQVLTVLAPVNGSFNKDSLLSLINAGKKKNVVNRFVKNHLMRYNVSLGNKAQSIYLLNDKIVNIGTLADNLIQNKSVSKANVGCSNGIVHVMGEDLPYQPNLFEFIEDDWDAFKATLDPSVNPDTIISLYNYLYKFNTDSLDEQRSVSRGVDLETGNTIYVDSVMIRNNKALAQLRAYLYREDSTYLAILPSQEAYQKRFEEAKKYFNFNVAFNSEQSVRDSIQNYYANYFTVCDLFFNMSESMNGKTQNDSLFSTVYSRRTWEYNKYLKPFSAGGILDSYQNKFDCSNGTMYTMNEIPNTKYDNFFKKIVVEAEEIRYLETGTDWTNSQSTSFSIRSSAADSISGSGMTVFSAASSTRNTEFAYQIPNTLSGKYDIYVRFLPYQAYGTDTTHVYLPSKFRAALYERDKTGTMPKSATYSFRTPEGSRNFVTNPYVIDTVYIGTYEFANSFYSTTPGVYFQLSSYVTTSERSSYTKDMIIDCFLFVPHKDEAEETTNE
jgi:uncharacterized surface protein with fasciclin (FAS1) repeats